MYQSAQGGYPQGGYPQGGYPQGGYPQGGYPPGSYPQGGYPQGSYPAGYPTPQPGFQPVYGGAGFGEPAGFPAAGQGSLGDDADVKGFDFNEQSIRKSFVRKVYSILMCQLLVTLAFITLFVYHQPTQMWVRRNPYLFWVAFAVMLVCLIAMACCGNVRRQAPLNFIFLGLFTVAESFMLGITSSMYDGSAVSAERNSTYLFPKRRLGYCTDSLFVKNNTICNAVTIPLVGTLWGV